MRFPLKIWPWPHLTDRRFILFISCTLAKSSSNSL